MLTKNLNLNEINLPIFKALASDIRLNILKILSKDASNIQDIAEKLNISPPATTAHIKKLHDTGLIEINKKPGEHGIQKICSLKTEELLIKLVEKSTNNLHEVSIPIGQYTDIKIQPTCGLASKNKIIGNFDQPEYFSDPDRISAGILWLGAGFIEYTIPNKINHNSSTKTIKITMEIGSEAKGANNDWPSDLSFYLNNINIGTWTSPGDFADRKGKLNPEWWGKGINQYGLLKTITINKKGTFMDEQKISDITIQKLELDKKTNIKFKIEAPENTKNPGGLTIYGQTFGDYAQDIKVSFLDS